MRGIVGHVKAHGDAPRRGRSASRLEVFFICMARFAKVDMHVPHAGEYMQAGSLDHSVSGRRVHIAADFIDHAIADHDVGNTRPAGLDDQASTNHQVSLEHVVLRLPRCRQWPYASPIYADFMSVLSINSSAGPCISTRPLSITYP